MYRVPRITLDLPRIDKMMEIERGEPDALSPWLTLLNSPLTEIPPNPEDVNRLSVKSMTCRRYPLNRDDRNDDLITRGLRGH
jgi:hypothetical protein